MAYDLCQLTDDLDLPQVQRPITGFDLVLQKVKIRLNRFRGEWPLDKTKGIDWIRYYANPAVAPSLIVFAVVEEIRAVAGVLQVTVDSYALNSATRELSIEISLIADGSDGPVRLGLQSRYHDLNGAPWAIFIGA